MISLIPSIVGFPMYRYKCEYTSQALICTYFSYHATDVVTPRVSCLFPLKKTWISMFTSHKTYIDCPFQITHSMHVTCSCGWDGSHTSYNFRTSVLHHQATPKIGIVNFLYITLLTPRFMNCLRVFWKMCWPQLYFVSVIYTLRKDCEQNMQSFMVCVNCCARYICYL
jgi:hypothetical protein